MRGEGGGSIVRKQLFPGLLVIATISTLTPFAVRNAASQSAPLLTDVEAYDVAGYIVTQKRPEKPNLERDFPIRLQKPIDTPYGPYADGFPAEQHRLGPFGPIRAKVKALAVESRTANAGGPDNGSQQSDGGR